MRKHILFITFFLLGFGSVYSDSKVNVIVQKVQESPKEESRYKVVHDSFHVARGTAKYLFSCVDDMLDYLLSFKGAIKSLIMIMPFLYLYCRYSGMDLSSLDRIFDKVIQFAASIEERYLIQREVGRAKAQLRTIIDQPKNSFLVSAKDYIYKTWNFVAYRGIPYATSIIFQSWMLSKNYTWKH